MYKHFVLNFQNKCKTKETETIKGNLQIQTCTETLYLKSAESFGQSSEIAAEVFLHFLTFIKKTFSKKRSENID